MTTLSDPVPVPLDRLARELHDTILDDWRYGRPKVEITARPEYVHLQAGPLIYQVRPADSPGCVIIGTEGPATIYTIRHAVRTVATEFYDRMLGLCREDWPLIEKEINL
jgi:hypothetical protein